jgi:hypothetical protein
MLGSAPDVNLLLSILSSVAKFQMELTGPTAVDTVVTRPCNPTGLSHHDRTIPGAAAAAARKQKCNTFQRHHMLGLTFFASTLESNGYLDTQAMKYSRHIASADANTGAVTYGSIVASVYRETSVALVEGNHGIVRAGVQGLRACPCSWLSCAHG